MRHTYEMPKDEQVARLDFSDFCEAHHDRLVGLLGLFCGSRDLGEEFAQETLMRAYRDWPKVQTMDSPSAWLYRVGTNLARSHFRRRRAESKAQSRLEAELSESARPGTETLEADAVVQVRESIGRLPVRMRTVVVLRYYGRLRITEIAAAMECSESTVKKLLRRALVRFRDEERITTGRESWDAS